MKRNAKEKARRRAQFAATPEHVKERARERCRAWRKLHPELVKAANAVWRIANPERKRTLANKWRATNLEHARAYARARYAANPDKYRAYGWQVQRISVPTRPRPKACEICERPFRGIRIKTLVADHNHVTKRFRGWLCTRCNLALGFFGDNAAGLQRALAYLERAE